MKGQYQPRQWYGPQEFRTSRDALTISVDTLALMHCEPGDAKRMNVPEEWAREAFGALDAGMTLILVAHGVELGRIQPNGITRLETSPAWPIRSRAPLRLEREL